MICRKWKNLNLQNQILIIHSVVIVSLLVILILLSFELVNRFSIFIEHELFQTIILKSMVRTIYLATDRVNQIKFLEYFQQSIDMRSMENLYYFQASNNIYTNSQVDDCLQREHFDQFYSYQFCYGIYGQLTNSSDLNQIKNFIALQNILLPMYQNKLEKTLYTVYLDQSLFFSQYQGEYLTFIHPDLMDVFEQMDISYSPGYYKEIIRNNLSMQLIFNNTPGTKIGIGILYNYSEDEFNKISQQDRYFSQKQIFLRDSGEIIYDSRNPDSKGLLFQNSNLTGFDETQFQKIKNFTFENCTVINECSFHVKKQFLCLVDQSGQPKIMQIDRIGAEDFIFYYLIISDANSSVQTIDEFNQKLQDSLSELIRNIFVFLIISIVISFILQIFFIQKLKKPLNELKDIAKCDIKNEQYKILTDLRAIRQQNQIQKLADSFYNLINLTQITKSKYNFQCETQNKKINYTQGIIQKRYQEIIVKAIKQQTIYLKGNHEQY